MSHPQLDNLVRIGQLKAEPPADAEIQGPLRSGLRRLTDAGRGDLSLEPHRMRRSVEEQVQALEKKREELRRKKLTLERAGRCREEVLPLVEAHIDEWGESFDRAPGAYLTRSIRIATSPVATVRYHSPSAQTGERPLDRFNPLCLLSDPSGMVGGQPQLKMDEPELFALHGLLAPLLKERVRSIILDMAWDENAVASEAARREELGKLSEEINQVSGEIETLVKEAQEAGIEL